MRPSPSRRARPAIDALEPRRLFAAASTIVGTPQEVGTTIPNFLSTAQSSLTLSTYFNDPNVPGTLVTFETSKGNILVSLTDAATPLEVANFLSYVSSGAYNGTIFHRSAEIATQATVISPSAPATIIQGGGYTAGSDGLTHIATTGTVNDEYTSNEYNNIAGTIAGAKTSSANSTGSEWYFNVSDNPGLDPADQAGTGTGYTVFGKVLSGMNVITTIASLPIDSLNTSPDGSTTTPAPVTGLTQAQINAMAAVDGSNLVYVNDVVEQPGTNYTVTSSDPSLVTPSVSGGVLSFKYATAAAGTAEVTVAATNAYDGTVASESFSVTVPPTSTTTTAAGPVTAADTVANVVSGVATAVRPLDNDTDAASPLDPATLTVVTPPADGSALPDAATPGVITYTSAKGFTGTDTFTYTVADATGAVSAPTTVTLDVIEAPQTFEIGAGQKLSAVTFTQPDGTKGRITVSGGGSAAVTFSSGTLTAPAPRGGVQAVSGAGATLSGVVVTDVGRALPTVTLTSTGKGSVTLGGLSDAGGLTAVVAPTATLTGVLSVTTLNRLTLAAAVGATVTIADTVGSTAIAIDTATDTALTAGVVSTFTSRKWTVDDGKTHAVEAYSIGTLTVPGGFADQLLVSSEAGYGITSATVGTPSAAWQVNAPLKRVTITSPASTWSLADGSSIQSLTVNGALTGDGSTTTVSAATIETMTVTGAMTNAIVETSAAFNSADVELARLSVHGAMTGSTVFSAGNIDAISAASMSGSRIYAGATAADVQTTPLPTATTDLSALATIKSVTLTAPKSTFANSDIAAYVLDAVRLGTVTAANSGTAFGVSAHTLVALSAVLDPGGRLALAKPQLKSAQVLSAYLTAKKITLSDFAIDLY